MANSDELKIAIEICNKGEFKSKVFNGTYRGGKEIGMYDLKKIWDKNVESTALKLLESHNLDENKQVKVIGFIHLISFRMLVWIEYFIRTLKLPRKLCIDLFEPSLFTKEGVIDNHKVSKEIFDKPLDDIQGFMLASFFCQKSRIIIYFKNLSNEDRNLFFDPKDPVRIKHPEIIKFWSYFCMGEINLLKGDDLLLDEYRLETAIRSGSQLAIKFCLENSSLKYIKDKIIKVTVAIVSQKMVSEMHSINSLEITNDLIVFRGESFKPKRIWIPNQFYVDIFYSMISIMSTEQKQKFIEELFIAAANLDPTRAKYGMFFKVLEYFLCWPYQDQFMDLLKTTSQQLPEGIYDGILLEIINKIEVEHGQLLYGENKIYNYRRLLMEVWTMSPGNFKRSLFNEMPNQDDILVKEGKRFLMRMFKILQLIEEDKRNIITILNFTLKNERENFLESEDGKSVCKALLKAKEFDFYEELISACIPTERARSFKKQFMFLRSKDPCLEYIKNDEWFRVADFLKCCELTDEETMDLKKQIIYSEDGMQTCLDLYRNNVGKANNYIELFLQSNDKIEDFKTFLALADEGAKFCKQLILSDQAVQASEFVHWCASSEDDEQQIKRMLPFMILLSTSDGISFNTRLETIDSDLIKEIIELKYTQKLVSWGFKAESELLSFKKDILQEKKYEIVMRFVDESKFSEAEHFLSWSETPKEEIKMLKKQIFKTILAGESSLDELISSKSNSERYVVLGGRDAALSSFLHWFLVDKEALEDFKLRFRCWRNSEVLKTLIPKMSKLLN